MKTLIRLATLAMIFAVPGSVFAQTAGPSASSTQTKPAASAAPATSAPAADAKPATHHSKKHSKKHKKTAPKKTEAPATDAAKPQSKN